MQDLTGMPARTARPTRPRSLARILARILGGRAAPWAAGAGALALAALAVPQMAAEAGAFAVTSLLAVAPAMAIGLTLSAAATASGVAAAIAPCFAGRTWRMILLAALVGALAPVCGISVLPLVAALLGAGVPLAAVMAFWLASPVTDPGMFAITAATLGTGFAIGKTLAAFAVGLFGGAVTAALAGHGRLGAPLRPDWQGAAGGCGSGAGDRLDLRFWRDPARRALFGRTLAGTGRLMLKWLSLAFLAEYLLRRFVPQDWIAGLAGDGNPLAVPAAALIGAPLYLDGTAALPLVRGLTESGMSTGAAMALLVAGGITSAWAAIPVYGLVRLPVFLLYLGLAVTGAMFCGWAADLILT